MILTNTTFCVDSSVAEDVVRFLHGTYFRLASGAGLYNLLLSEMRSRDDESGDSRTYALQMRAPSQAVLDAFAGTCLPKIYGYMAHTWGRKVSVFETVLDVIHESPRDNGRQQG